MKQNITQYSRNELSLIVYNNEIYYFNRFNDNFVQDLKQDFIFTREQKEILIRDIKEEREETIESCY